MASCTQCGRQDDLRVCNGCDRVYCPDCINPADHGCETASEDRSMSRLEQMQPSSRRESPRRESLQEEQSGSYCPSCGSDVEPGDEFCRNCGAELGASRRSGPRSRKPVPRSQSHPQSESRGNILAGAILLAVGAVISLSGIGIVIGVPLAILGFGVMFPRFAAAVMITAMLVGILLFISL